MEATMEISMYPLDASYEQHIIAFIEALKKHNGFEVRVNETSTHLFGDYDAMFDALKAEVKQSYLKLGKSVFVVKVLGANLKGSAEDL